MPHRWIIKPCNMALHFGAGACIHVALLLTIALVNGSPPRNPLTMLPGTLCNQFPVWRISPFSANPVYPPPRCPAMFPAMLPGLKVMAVTQTSWLLINDQSGKPEEGKEFIGCCRHRNIHQVLAFGVQRLMENRAGPRNRYPAKPQPMVAEELKQFCFHPFCFICQQDRDTCQPDQHRHRCDIMPGMADGEKVFSPEPWINDSSPS